MENGGTLHILWTNTNPITAEQMVFMYSTNSLLRKWWDEVHLIVWGENTRLLCENARLQELLKNFQEHGGSVTVCKRCAENLGVLEKLEQMGGMEIIYVGEQFTHILKSGERLLTV